MATLQDVLDFFEYLFPSRLALPDDRTGLHIRGKRNHISRILVALELNQNVYQSVLQNNIDFLYLHHPPIWDPLTQFSSDDPWCVMLVHLFQEGITVLAHHTNIDVCWGGIADQWIKLLHLNGSVEPLSPLSFTSYKIVTFVPPQHLEPIIQSLFKAGGGRIDNYQSCSFQCEGIGTFFPLENTQPFIGKVGRFERVKEIRVEVTLSDPSSLGNSVEAIKKVHPYQKPVIDVYSLHQNSTSSGLGRAIILDKSLHLIDFIMRFQPFPKIYTSIMNNTNQTEGILNKIALCPGSGGSLLGDVIAKNFDMYITGDLDHHEIEKLKLYHILYCPLPHGEGERLGLKMIFKTIRQIGSEQLPDLQFFFEDNF